MNAHLSTGVRKICEFLIAHARSRTGLSQKAMKELLRQTDFPSRLESYRPQGRVCCGDVAELCRPVLERLCPEPPEFCLLETANDPGSALHLPGIQQRLDHFAQNIRRQLFPETDA